MTYRTAKLRDCKITKLQNSSRGYILITLMLFLTLLAIGMLTVLPEMAQQIQRDREEEMVHRGTEYMRAIKSYYKKFGRYPSRIEELENTNQIRYLRKRYKDPSGKGEKDFKLVRVGDPSLNMLGLGGQGLGGPAPGPGINPGLGANPGGGPSLPQGGKLLTQPTSGTLNPPGGDADNPDAQGDAKQTGSSSDSGPVPGGQVFGGGPILGVVSTNKGKTIREFNRKNHYNDWLFIYDPNSDRGGLLKGPIQPDANRRSIGGINPTGTTTPTNQPGGPPSPPVQQGQPGQQETPDEQ